MKKTSIITCVVLTGAILASAALHAGMPSNNHVKIISQQKSIHLNTADAAALLHAIKGLGQKRADAIVAYRTAHGAFKSIADLAHVRGFGPRFVQANLKQLQTVFVL